MQAISSSIHYTRPSEHLGANSPYRELPKESSTLETNPTNNENSRIEQSYAEKALAEGIDHREGFTTRLHDMTCFPPEIHIQITKFLSSESIKALRLSNSILHRNIGTDSLTKQIKIEFELKKKETEQKYMRVLFIDENENAVNDCQHLFATVEKFSERQSIKRTISEILSDNKLSRCFREKYPKFNESVQKHVDNNGELPLQKNWCRHLERQSFTQPKTTWISSLTLEVIFSYHKPQDRH